MNQPPKHDPPAQWRRPRGVSVGTWRYVNERSIADHYDAFVADTPLCRLDLQILLDLFPRVGCETPITVFDLGCGSGRTAIPLATLGYDVVGIDLSQPMLHRLHSKSEQLAPGSGSVSGVRANLVELGCFADRVADHAICLFSTMGMIQGRPHRYKMLRHVARIVRPGGRLVLHVHHRWAALREPGGALALLRSWTRSCFDRDHELGDATYAYRGIEAMFMHRFSKRELIGELNLAGWDIERIESVSVDGSRAIQPRVWKPWQTGGFIVIARRPG